MQEFTEEWKAIKKALSNCWGEKSAKGTALRDLVKARGKVFADIALGLKPTSGKKKINNEIRGLKEDIEDLDIMVEELELRQMLLKRSGGHIREKIEED